MADERGDLRLGLVGFGRLARAFYVPALRTLAGVRLVAVADPAPESRAAATACFAGAAIHAGHRELLDHARLDGVLVASPPSAHLAVWSDVTARGLAAFVEKPLVLSTQTAALAGRPRGERVMVDFNRRFWPPYERVRALVAEGVLGAPVHVEFTLHLDVLGWSRVTRHRFDAGEGGLLHDLGCHAVDLALVLIGEEPAHIEAVAASRRWADDRLHIRIAFPGGGSASCDLGYGDRTRERLVVRGPHATARLVEPNAALHLEPSGRRRNLLLAGARDVAMLGYRALRRSQTIGRATIRDALAAFAHALRTGARFSPGFEDGARNARWVAAAARSAADGGTSARP